MNIGTAIAIVIIILLMGWWSLIVIPLGLMTGILSAPEITDRVPILAPK